MYYPKHDFPLKRIGISASQNVYGNQAERDEKDARSYVGYLKQGLMPSLKFTRTADELTMGTLGYDENKAIFPIYHDVPLFAVTTIAALDSGLEVAVIGSHEIRLYVDSLCRFYAAKGMADTASRLKWIPELPGLEDRAVSDYDKHMIISDGRKMLKQSNSLNRLAKSLCDKVSDAWAFVAADIIMYDYLSVTNDKDIIGNTAVLDLNGLETINPPVPRNYYHALITEDKRRIHFKEPNVWLVGAEANLEMSDVLYANRMNGGFGLKQVLTMAGMNMIRHSHLLQGRDFRALFEMIMYEAEVYISKKTGGKGCAAAYKESDINSLAKFIFMSPLRIKAEHNDWLRLKDVDAMHDYVLIRALVEGHAEEIFPKPVFLDLKGFDSFLQKERIASKVPIVRDFPLYMNDKNRRVMSIVKRMTGIEAAVEDPFDADGNLRHIFGDGENLLNVTERARRDLERYEEKRGSILSGFE